MPQAALPSEVRGRTLLSEIPDMPQTKFAETPLKSLGETAPHMFQAESTPDKVMQPPKALQPGILPFGTPKQAAAQRAGAMAGAGALFKTPKRIGERGRRSPRQEGGAFVGLSPEIWSSQRASPPQGFCHPPSKQEAEIAEALREDSLTMLELALTAGHGAGHPVYEAVRLEHMPALRFLLRPAGSKDRQCHIDAPWCGRRPLHCAIRACRSQGDVAYTMVEMLLQHGARPDACEGDDITQAPPLHAAAAQGVASVVSLLLAHGAGANAADAKGCTPLQVVCQSSSAWASGLILPTTPPQLPAVDFFQFFGGNGEDRPGVYPAGMPVQSLMSQRRGQVVDLLLRGGADPMVTDEAGLTARRYSCDKALCEKLAKAERWWKRRMLILVRGSPKGDSDTTARSLLFLALIPEIIEAVTAFL